MRKSFKKGMAMLLAAAMVFSTPVALEKTTAKAAADPTPVIGLDFEDGVAEGTSYTEGGFAFDVAGGAKVVANPDDAQDKVMALTPDSDGTTTGTQYITTKADALKDLDFSKGFSISMALKPTKQKTDWNYLFSAGSLDVGGNERWLDGTIGFIARYAAAYKANFPGDGWVSGNPVNSNFQYFTAGDGVNKWTNLTYVYGEDNVSVYVDGLLTNQWKSEAAIKTILGQLNAGKLSIGGGIDPKLEHFTGYVDDVNVYNSALNASQVYKAATGQDAVADGLLGDISAELDEEGKKINLKYNTKMSIPADDLSISVNGKVVATGSAVSASPVSGAATYVYTPEEDGEYKFVVAAKEQAVNGNVYLEQTVTATAKVKKEGGKFVYDADLFEGFQAEEGGEGLNITWKALNGATVAVKVTGGGKTINLTAPRTVKFSELTAGTKYTVTLTATKAGYATKTASKDYTYSTKFEAYTVGTTDKKTAFWKAFSKPYQINDGKTRVVELEVHGGTNLYNNFVLAFADQENFDEATRGTAYREYAAIRTDKWGWGGGDNKSLCGKDIQYVSHSLVSGGKTMKMGDTGFDAAFIAIMDSANATVEVARSGKMLEITMKIVSTKNAKNIITSVTKLELGSKDGKDNGTGKVYMRITPDMSYFTVKNVTEKTAGKIDPPVDPNPPVVSAKVSKVSITVPNRKAGKTVYMKKGDKVTLKATVKGSGKYSKSVTWKTSKKSVATVSSKGKVTAKKAGTAKITATSKTDKSKKATITIKVSKKAVKNKTLKISPTKKTLKKGKSLTIKIKKITKKTTDKITYKSSKKSVATVDAYGKVKAKKKGKATITVKCGKKSAKLKLTVKK